MSCEQSVLVHGHVGEFWVVHLAIVIPLLALYNTWLCCYDGSMLLSIQFAARKYIYI